VNKILESLNFDDVEDGWNDFKKIFCGIFNGVFVKNARNAARIISKNILYIIERRGTYTIFV